MAKYKRMGEKMVTTGNRVSFPKAVMEHMGLKKDTPVIFLVYKPTGDIVIKKGKSSPTDLCADDIDEESEGKVIIRDMPVPVSAPIESK